MSPRHAALGRVVPVLGTGVQDVAVAQELNVTHVEDHVQLDAVAHGLEGFEGVDLFGAQRWDDAFVAEPGQTADVVRVPFTIDSVLLTLRVGRFVR